MILEAIVDPNLSSAFGIYASNHATLNAADDVVLTNNRAGAVVALRTQGFVDLSLKMLRAGAFVDDGRVAYHLGASNVGEAAVSSGVQLTQTFPAGVTIVSAAGDGWDCAISGQTVTCDWVGGEVLAGDLFSPSPSPFFCNRAAAWAPCRPPRR